MFVTVNHLPVVASVLSLSLSLSLSHTNTHTHIDICTLIYTYMGLHADFQANYYFFVIFALFPLS